MHKSKRNACTWLGDTEMNVAIHMGLGVPGSEAGSMHGQLISGILCEIQVSVDVLDICRHGAPYVEVRGVDRCLVGWEMQDKKTFLQMPLCKFCVLLILIYIHICMWRAFLYCHQCADLARKGFLDTNQIKCAGCVWVVLLFCDWLVEVFNVFEQDE